MAKTVILGFFTAMGILSVLWAGLGWLLPGGTGGVTVLCCGPGLKEEAFVRRWRWLRGLGLVQSTLLVVDRGLAPQERAWLSECGLVEFCSLEDLPARLELERNQVE